MLFVFLLIFVVDTKIIFGYNFVATLICCIKTQTSHYKRVDKCRRMQTGVEEGLDKCKRVQTSRQTSLDEIRRLQTSLDECRRVQTNVEKCKQIKKMFDINGGLPRWMLFNLRLILTQKHRQMKKFILRCNRCTVVTRLFNLDIVRI